MDHGHRVVTRQQPDTSESEADRQESGPAGINDDHILFIN